MNAGSRSNRYQKIKKKSIPFNLTLSILSEGFSTKFGLFFFFAIAVFYLSFTPSFKDFKFSNASPTVVGRIINIIETNNNIADNRIYKYEFEYTVDGIKYLNTSYSQKNIKNDTITIEYLVENPAISRIKGMTVGVISSGVFFVILFLQLISLIIFLYGILGNLWTLKLVKIGQVAYLKVTSKEEIIKKNTAYFELKYFFIDVNNHKIESVYKSIDDYFDYAWILYNPINHDEYIFTYLKLENNLPWLKEEMKKAELRHLSYLGENKKEESNNVEDYEYLEDKIKILLKSKDIDKAINLAEEELKKVPKTEFHKVLGKNLLNDNFIFEMKKFIDDYDKSIRTGGKNKWTNPAAYMCEIHNFEDEGKIICDLSAYKKKKSNNLEWLDDMNNMHELIETKNIEYFSEVTDYFKKISEDSKYYKPENETAFIPCEIIIILRVIELFTEIYKKSENNEWSRIPMYISGEENFLLYKIN